MSEPLHAAEIKAFIEEHKDDMFALWQKFVDTPSQDADVKDEEHLAEDRAKLHHMAEVLKEAFDEAGLDTELIEVGGDNDAPVVYGVWGADRPGAPLLFSGHYDTVRLGDRATTFHYDEVGHVRGLGSLDMKGGIAIAVWVVKALQHIGWAERPVKFLFVGDEETGHIGTNVPEIIMEKSKGALCAFNMETGLPGNEICIGRKGNANAYFTVSGVSAHSGNEWEKGRNAILEASYLIQELDALTRFEDCGTTVAATVIGGGTVPNSIPNKCEVVVNIRTKTKAEHDRVFDALADIAKNVHIDGCGREYTAQDLMGPFDDPTGEGKRLASFVSTVSERLDMGEMGQKELGGGSDASFISLAGVPTICSIGVRGEFNHTDKEYAMPETLLERAILLANVSDSINEFEAGKPTE